MDNIKFDKKRSLFKALTWRLISSTATFIIGWIMTGEIETGLWIGGVDAIIKFVLYYYHERLWHKSNLGVHDKKD